MEWSSSVSEAITRCKATQSKLLILIEPHPTTSKTSTSLLAKIATSSLHKHLFANAAVQKLFSKANIAPVRIVMDPQNHEYTSFIQYFRHDPPPDMLLVSFDGAILWRHSGYVTPRQFVSAVGTACGVDVRGWFGEKKRSARLVLPEPTVPKGARSHTEPTKTASVKPATEVVKSPTEAARRQTLPPHEPKDIVKKPVPLEARSKKTTKRPLERGTSVQPTTLTAPKSGMSLPAPKKAKLQARLPSGDCVTASYLPNTPFHNVRTWLSESSKLPSKQLHIVTAFPRYIFDDGDDRKTLEELGLCPSASLIVADHGPGAVCGDGDDGIFARGREALAGVGGVVTGFFASFFGPSVSDEQEDSESGEERERFPDEDNLRYNGNSTQFGYDDR